MNEAIKGSGPNFYKNRSAANYRERVATPSNNAEYFHQFHEPMLNRAKKEFGTPIRVLDIAVGPADELRFIKDDPEIKIIATDISMDILPHVQNEFDGRIKIFASDASHSALKENVVEAGIMVNALVYVPDKMLSAMYGALKPGGFCTANFRVFDQSREVLSGVRELGIQIYDSNLEVHARKGAKTFKIKIVDFSRRVDLDGRPDLESRPGGQQIFFKSVEDLKELVEMSGFEQIEHGQFYQPNFVSVAGYVQVFTFRKPLTV